MFKFEVVFSENINFLDPLVLWFKPQILGMRVTHQESSVADPAMHSECEFAADE